MFPKEDREKHLVRDTRGQLNKNEGWLQGRK